MAESALDIAKRLRAQAAVAQVERDKIRAERRARMPVCTAFFESMTATFGDGVRMEWASENSVEFGRRS